MNTPVFMIVGDTARNPGRSGIQTVVRSLAAAFGKRGAPVRPVAWHPNSGHLRPLRRDWSLGLGAEPLRDPPGWPVGGLLAQPATWLAWLLAGGRGEFVPLHRHPRHRTAPRGSWVLLPELLYRNMRARQLVDYVHARGWRLAVIFHDAIPVQHPEFVPPELPALHAEYMRALSHADLILPNSEASADGWREFMQREGLASPPVRTCTLACDLPGTPRVLTVPDADAKPGAPVRMLCVSTLEPRKNHRTLFAAYELAVAQRPELRLELDLVGAPYVGSPEIADDARKVLARQPGMRWHEKVEHGRLHQLYEACDFTVYPSVLEGFGLPVIESLWFARPCLCANFGVMAENALGGGCLTTDVRVPKSLADAMISLAVSPERRRALAQEAVARKLKTWGEYADEVLAAMDDLTNRT